MGDTSRIMKASCDVVPIVKTLVDLLNDMDKPIPSQEKLNEASRHLRDEWIETIDDVVLVRSMDSVAWETFRRIVKEHLQVRDIFFDRLLLKLTGGKTPKGVPPPGQSEKLSQPRKATTSSNTGTVTKATSSSNQEASVE